MQKYLFDVIFHTLEVFILLTITGLLLKSYLRQPVSQNRHLLLAFSFLSLGFILLFVGTLITQLSSYHIEAHVFFIKFFDIFEMIAAFWFFAFLTDFVKPLRRYLSFSRLMLIPVVVGIFVFPVKIVEQEINIARSLPTFLLILFYWVVHFSILSYQFFKNSSLVEEKEARIKIQIFTISSILALVAYPTLLVDTIFPSWAVYSLMLAEVYALSASILFYLGLNTPRWLEKWL